MKKCFPVVKRRRTDGMIMMVVAVFETECAAVAWKDSANAWYGEGHPLTPLEVLRQDTVFEPRPFPAV